MTRLVGVLVTGVFAAVAVACTKYNTSPTGPGPTLTMSGSWHGTWSGSYMTDTTITHDPTIHHENGTWTFTIAQNGDQLSATGTCVNTTTTASLPFTATGAMTTNGAFLKDAADSVTVSGAVASTAASGGYGGKTHATPYYGCFTGAGTWSGTSP